MNKNSYFYREPGQAPILVRETKSERESIITYAREHGLSVSQARQQLVTAQLARQEQESLQSGIASAVVPEHQFKRLLNLSSASGITVSTLIQNVLCTALQNQKDTSPVITDTISENSIVRDSFDMSARYYSGGSAFYTQEPNTVLLAREPATTFYPAIAAEFLNLPSFRRPEPAPQMYDLSTMAAAGSNAMQEELRKLIDLHKATEAKNQKQMEALSAKTDTVLQAAMRAADKSTEAAKGSGFSLIKVSFLSELFSGKFSIGAGKDKDFAKSNEPKVGALKKWGSAIKDGTVTGTGSALKLLAIAGSMAGILAATAQLGNYVTPSIPTASQMVATVQEAAHLEISAKKGIDVSFTLVQPANLLNMKAEALVRVHGADKDPLKMEDLKKSLGDEASKAALDGSTNDFNNKVALFDAVKAVEAKQLSNHVTNSSANSVAVSTPSLTHP